MINLTEFNKLEDYLKANHYDYTREDSTEHKHFEYHQLIVYKHHVRDWDAICSTGSYGSNYGLLEIMGNLVTEEDGDSVVGSLTTEDIIKRLNKDE